LLYSLYILFYVSFPIEEYLIRYANDALAKFKGREKKRRKKKAKSLPLQYGYGSPFKHTQVPVDPSHVPLLIHDTGIFAIGHTEVEPSQILPLVKKKKARRNRGKREKGGIEKIRVSVTKSYSGSA
jgi:hypothetical protein